MNVPQIVPVMTTINSESGSPTPCGFNAEVNLTSIPTPHPIPASIENLGNRDLLERARAAWLACVELQDLFHLWMVFLTFGDLRNWITARNQRAIVQIAPEFRDLRVVLRALSVPRPVSRNGQDSWDTARSRQLPDLILAVNRGISTRVRILHQLDVDSLALVGPLECVLARFRTLTYVHLKFPEDRPLNFAATLQNIGNTWNQLRAELAEIERLFATQPLVAFRMARLSVDINTQRITLDGEPYRVTQDQASIVNLLLAAGGKRISSSQMQKQDPALKGVRIDRLRESLPKPIRDLITAVKGKGYFLRLS